MHTSSPLSLSVLVGLVEYLVDVFKGPSLLFTELVYQYFDLYWVYFHHSSVSFPSVNLRFVLLLFS